MVTIITIFSLRENRAKGRRRGDLGTRPTAKSSNRVPRTQEATKYKEGYIKIIMIKEENEREGYSRANEDSIQGRLVRLKAR